MNDFMPRSGSRHEPVYQIGQIVGDPRILQGASKVDVKGDLKSMR
jgi:hypothetical protein